MGAASVHHSAFFLPTCNHNSPDFSHLHRRLIHRFLAKICSVKAKGYLPKILLLLIIYYPQIWLRGQVPEALLEQLQSHQSQPWVQRMPSLRRYTIMDTCLSHSPYLGSYTVWVYLYMAYHKPQPHNTGSRLWSWWATYYCCGRGCRGDGCSRRGTCSRKRHRWSCAKGLEPPLSQSKHGIS